MGALEHITEDGIAMLVDRFYAKVRRDPMIGPLFNAAIDDWDAHLAPLRAFWSSVMLTTGRYKGNPMGAHLKHPIRPEFFTRWLELWGETADELFVPAVAEQFRLLHQDSNPHRRKRRAGRVPDPVSKDRRIRQQESAA